MATSTCLDVCTYMVAADRLTTGFALDSGEAVSCVGKIAGRFVTGFLLVSTCALICSGKVSLTGFSVAACGEVGGSVDCGIGKLGRCSGGIMARLRAGLGNAA